MNGDRLFVSDNRCPFSDDGTHAMVDLGYDPSMFGHVNNCECGLRRLNGTDEFRARYGMGPRA